MKTAEIVGLKIDLSFRMSLDKLDSFEGRKKVASLLRRWERASKLNTFLKLAKKVNLTPKTISNVASEVTVWPRWHTVLSIMMGLGFAEVTFHYHGLEKE